MKALLRPPRVSRTTLGNHEHTFSGPMMDPEPARFLHVPQTEQEVVCLFGVLLHDLDEFEKPLPRLHRPIRRDENPDWVRALW